MKKNTLLTFMGISLLAHAAFASWLVLGSPCLSSGGRTIMEVTLVSPPGPQNSLPEARSASAIQPRDRVSPPGNESPRQPASIPKAGNDTPVAEAGAHPSPAAAPGDQSATDMTATGGNAPAVAPSARQPHGSGEPAIQSYDKLTDDIIFRNRLYPSMARNRKIEGVVRMTVTIDKTGRASNIRVVKTSGSSTLDRASVQTIQRCLFPPPPTDLITLTKTITFRLEDDSRS